MTDQSAIYPSAQQPASRLPNRAGAWALFKHNRWWMTRIAVMPLHLALFGLAIFFLVRLIPGDPVLTVVGIDIDPELYARVKTDLGLDGSTLTQLSAYYQRLMHLDLGRALLSGRPVIDDLWSRFPPTVELALLCLISVSLVSFAAAVYAVMRPATLLARSTRAYAHTAGAIPEFVVGVALIFIFYATLGWAPAPLGRVSPGLEEGARITGMPLLDSVLGGHWAVTGSMLSHLLLPILVAVITHSAIMIRILIGGLEQSLDAAPTRFRIASGASRSTVIMSMLRRALPPAVTMLGTLFGYLLGGAVILEQLFGFSGVGRYIVDAVNAKDIVAMQGFLLVVGIVSLLVFLLVDMLNMWLDPRRRPGIQVES